MYRDNTELQVVDIKRSKQRLECFLPRVALSEAWVTPRWGYGRTQWNLRSHISCSSSGTSKPNSSWCRFPPQAHREPPLRGAAPLNSFRSEKVPGKKKVGSFLLRALSLSLPSAKSFHDLEVWHLFYTFWLQAVETLLLFILLKAAIVQKTLLRNPCPGFKLFYWSFTHAAVLELKNNICDYIISSDLHKVWKRASLWPLECTPSIIAVALFRNWILYFVQVKI